MKIVCSEHEHCFGFELVAENMQEAAFLVRFARSATTEVRHAAASVHQNGEVFGSLVLGKRRRDRSYLQVGKP